MSRCRSRLLGVALALAAAVVCPPPALADRDPGQGLPRAVAALRAAFERSSASSLRALLSEDRRVFLAVPPVWEDADLFGPQQVYHYFEDFFRRYQTRGFEVQPLHAVRRGDPVTVSARWRYADKEGGVREEGLRVVLIEEEGRWRVREIRSGPR